MQLFLRILQFLLLGTALSCTSHERTGGASTQTFHVVGLEEAAEILVDAWGVPHIYAQNYYDAFFVQGFNAARDRLWQLDLWRRKGLGLLSSVLGSDYIARDRANRIFLYRGDMYREWLAYGSDTKRIVESFTNGINAYIDYVSRNRDRLPPEFVLLGYEPAKWEASDVVRIRSHGVWRNATSEVQRARIVCRSGINAAYDWFNVEPKTALRIPEGLDPCVIPRDVLSIYQLARSDVIFSGAAELNSSTSAPEPTPGESNNWVVGPSRTSTGRPILANDPHRYHRVPSLRYIAHIVAPGLNVIGAGEPSLPGISIGHNDRIAFGLTLFFIDQEDLYVYEKQGDGYRYADGIEAFREVNERIDVKGQDAVESTIRFTRHGPVIYENATHAFAVRGAWQEAGTAPYLASLSYMRASNWREFAAALNRWGAPGENQVYADVEGNIAYKPAGLFPRREGWSGLLPVPGDGRYEWRGFYDMDVLPSESNPRRGFVLTANSNPLPEQYPIDRYPMSFEWFEPWRHKRIDQQLATQDNHSLVDSMKLQLNERSVLAESIIERLPNRVGNTAVTTLKNWDAVLSADSSEAVLYVTWLEEYVKPKIQSNLSPSDPGLLDGIDNRTILRVLDQPDTAEALVGSLDLAYEHLQKELGSDTTLWTWGSLHKTALEHPLLSIADAALSGEMALPKFPMGGSAHVPNANFYTDASYNVQGGASYRQVIDVGNWDSSVASNSPGQSGDPRSPYYDNLLEDWAGGGYFPLLYSRREIDKNAVARFVLKPSE